MSDQSNAALEGLLHPAPHPRLFADRSAIERVVQDIRSDPTLARIAAAVRRDADVAVKAEPVSFEDRGSFQMHAMRQLEAQIMATAMTYRLTGERAYFDAARRDLLVLAGRPDWNPKHFLDVGEACLASGIGLDWLHDDLSADDRKRIATAIVNNGLKPSLEVLDLPGSWVSGDFNWNPVCHGGLTVGALAIAEREPALARAIVDRAIRCLPFAAKLYAPDGTYAEGPSYWSYGTTFYVVTVEALRTALGTGFGLERQPGFLQSPDFVRQMETPTGGDFDFADSHREHLPEPAIAWFARENRRPDLLIPEEAALDRLAKEKGSFIDHLDGLSRFMPMQLLWWDTSLPKAVVNPLPTAWVAGGSVPVGVFRSAWDDPQATYVAVKGGTCNGSHAHMDVGSFILEACGVRWAIDLGAQDYRTMRAAKIDLWNYGQASSRWSVFRCGPQGHNNLRFDGQRQVANARADISTLKADAGGHGARVDLTAVYANEVSEAHRDVVLHPDRSVSIIDEWTIDVSPGQASSQWLTKALVTASDAGFTLSQDGATLDVRVVGPAGLRIVVEDVSRPRGPQDSPNPGVSRISIHVPTAANTRATLTMHASATRP